ncbi:hypothetical protein [Parendozoicomonas haliclonae]|uniref:NAD/FAD-utilizing enzyme apparently involved in cell division n=1 Tax=Parendozoicomonas haliclonae TaxID=1960125 RepID=A0A1X7AGY3_9GAMM|nr:hypothetical protein [Parendozoicomonas haliclonae]SMA41647.1 hypothetical protein EHSB41UT_01291 [Parendozoicomonas haliclonae]
MKQYHYLFDSLNDLERACYDLEDLGVAHNHLHVANNNHLSLEKKHLNDVGTFGDTDLIHSGLRGLIIGVVASAVCGTLTWMYFGHHELGGVITAFVSLIALGFSTWLGGLIGANHDNWRLSPYHDLLADGKSLLIVDMESGQEEQVQRLMASQHREAVHTGESSSVDSPLKGGWHLHLKEFKQVA